MYQYHASPFFCISLRSFVQYVFFTFSFVRIICHVQIEIAKSLRRASSRLILKLIRSISHLAMEVR